MVELDIEGVIPMEMVINKTEEELENTLHREISDKISSETMKHVDDMAFVDMEVNEEKQEFEYKASIVICSKQDIVTSYEIMSQKLAGYGLSTGEIIDVLSTQQNSTGGF